MKMRQFLFTLGVASMLLAACAGATQPASPTSTDDDGGVSSPGTGSGEEPVLTWQRTGGIAGFCDIITVFPDGMYAIENCSSQTPLQGGQLNADQMKMLTDWRNRFQSFEDGEDSVTPSYPDQMFVKTVFRGNGSAQPGPEDILAISNFASTLTIIPSSSGEYPEAAYKARDFLAKELGIPADQITIVSAEAMDWPDSCLGLGRADEMCAQMITPGYKVILEAQGKQYELHTDATGESVRQVP